MNVVNIVTQMALAELTNVKLPLHENIYRYLQILRNSGENVDEQLDLIKELYIRQRVEARGIVGGIGWGNTTSAAEAEAEFHRMVAGLWSPRPARERKVFVDSGDKECHLFADVDETGNWFIGGWNGHTDNYTAIDLTPEMAEKLYQFLGSRRKLAP